VFRNVYEVCLFPCVSTTLGPACKSDSSRKAAFALLTSIVKWSADASGATSTSGSLALAAAAKQGHKQARSSLGQVLERHFNSPDWKDLQGWEQDFQRQLKDPGVGVGLLNQGATCYMNSFLQQLFSVKEVKY
jgi:hypothetical protein